MSFHFMQVIYTIISADMVIYILMYLNESISWKESHIEFVEQNLGTNLGSIVVEKSGCCVRKYVCFLWGRFSNDVLLFSSSYEIDIKILRRSPDSYLRTVH